MHQTVIVLVGIPASGVCSLLCISPFDVKQLNNQITSHVYTAGKTTTVSLLQELGNFEVISQDQLGSRLKCETAFKRALSEGHNIIVDRCNHTKKQRMVWTDLVQAFTRRTGAAVSLVALVLKTPKEECMARALFRRDHPTLPVDQSGMVIERFYWEFENVRREREGFKEVHEVAAVRQLEGALQRIAAAVVEGVPGPSASSNAAAVQGKTEGGGCTQKAAAAEKISTIFSKQQALPPEALPPRWHPRTGGTDWRGAPGVVGVQSPLASTQQPVGVHTGNVAVAAAAAAANNGVRGDLAIRSNMPSSAVPAAGTWQRGASPSPTGRSNVVPFSRNGRPADGQPSPGRHARSGGRAYLDDEDDDGPGRLDARAILLFDLNGTLTSHTSKRRSAGRNRPRPGTRELRRLLVRHGIHADTVMG
jgi:hypothetical protein